MIAGYSGVLTFAGKLITDLRRDNTRLQDKVINDVIPALQASTAAQKEQVASTERILDAVKVKEYVEQEKGRRK